MQALAEIERSLPQQCTGEEIGGARDAERKHIGKITAPQPSVEAAKRQDSEADVTASGKPQRQRQDTKSHPFPRTQAKPRQPSRLAKESRPDSKVPAQPDLPQSAVSLPLPCTAVATKCQSL